MSQMLMDTEDGGEALGQHRAGHSRKLSADRAGGRAHLSPGPEAVRRPVRPAQNGPCHRPLCGRVCPVLCCHGGDRQGPGLVRSRG